jgi:hypothetical protein
MLRWIQVPVATVKGQFEGKEIRFKVEDGKDGTKYTTKMLWKSCCHKEGLAKM